MKIFSECKKLPVAALVISTITLGVNGCGSEESQPTSQSGPTQVTNKTTVNKKSQVTIIKSVGNKAMTPKLSNKETKNAAIEAESIDIPRLLGKELKELGGKTELPVLLPEKIASYPGKLEVSIQADEVSYGVSLNPPNCKYRGCLQAYFYGAKGDRYLNYTHKIQLAKSLKGSFRPLQCSSEPCYPPSIDWIHNGNRYSIQLQVPAAVEIRRKIKTNRAALKSKLAARAEKDALVQAANSAIMAGDRSQS